MLFDVLDFVCSTFALSAIAFRRELSFQVGDLCGEHSNVRRKDIVFSACASEIAAESFE